MQTSKIYVKDEQTNTQNMYIKQKKPTYCLSATLYGLASWSLCSLLCFNTSSCACWLDSHILHTDVPLGSARAAGKRLSNIFHESALMSRRAARQDRYTSTWATFLVTKTRKPNHTITLTIAKTSHMQRKVIDKKCIASDILQRTLTTEGTRKKSVESSLELRWTHSGQNPKQQQQQEQTNKTNHTTTEEVLVRTKSLHRVSNLNRFKLTGITDKRTRDIKHADTRAQRQVTMTSCIL